MTVSKDIFKTVAKGNGCPCRGDEFEGFYNGDTYRAEYYLDSDGGYLSVKLAADSPVEKKTATGWVPVDIENDDIFNEIVNAICPKIKN